MSSMKNTKSKKKNGIGRIVCIMFLILILSFLFLSFLTVHFDRKRENKQDEMKRNTLLTLAVNERQEIEAAEERFDSKLALLLDFTSETLRKFVTEDGYTGPCLFESGFVVELKDSRLIFPDGIPEGELQLTWELAEKGIASGKMRTGLLNTENGSYYLSCEKISDNFIYVEMTAEDEYTEYLSLYTAQSDSAMQAAVGITGGNLLFFRHRGNELELLRQYKADSQTKELTAEGISEDLRRKETEITLNGVKYTCSYSDLTSAAPDTDGLTMVYMVPQQSFRGEGILQSALICLTMLFIFITAIVYVVSIKSFVMENVLTEEEAEQYHPKKIRRRIKNSGIVGALAVFVVAVVLLATGHVTLEMRYGRDSLNAFSDQLEEYRLYLEKEAEQKEAEWYVRYGERISSLLSAYPQLASAGELQDICDVLKIDYIMLFDAAGKETLCSRDYVGFVLDKDLGENAADFRRLLQGVPAVIHEPSSDSTTGLEHQLIGVKMRDEKREGHFGALIMAVIPEYIGSAGRITDPNGQMKLMTTGGTVCFAADNSTKEVFLSGDSSMIGKTITALGLPDESLETGYMDFVRLEGTGYYIITKSFNDITFYYATESSAMFRYDYLCAAVSALLFALGFAVLLGDFLKKYDEKTFEEWAVVSIPAEDPGDKAIRETIVRRRELKAEVKDKHGEERLNSYWQKLLQILHWDEKQPGEKAGFLFNMGVFILLLCWMILLFRRNIVFGDYRSLAGFLLRGDWRRGLTLFCLGGILLVITNAYFLYVICVWLLLLIATVFPGKGETVCRLLKSVVKYVSFFAVLYFSLGYLGFPVATIVASLGIVSLALSLGAQDLVADIIAGLFIVFEGSFRVGDYITINGTRVVVREIGVRSTKLITPVNNLLIINNHKINDIVNLSKKASVYKMKVNISADIPLQQVEELLLRELPLMGEKNDLIISGPYYIGVEAIGSAVSFGKPSKTIAIGANCLEKDVEEVGLYINREVVLLFARENIRLL